MVDCSSYNVIFDNHSRNPHGRRVARRRQKFVALVSNRFFAQSVRLFNHKIIFGRKTCGVQSRARVRACHVDNRALWRRNRGKRNSQLVPSYSILIFQYETRRNQNSHLHAPGSRS